MGEQRRPIEQIAAEEIAADEERSRGWVVPKAVIGLPAALLPWWRNNLLWAGAAALVVVLLLAGALAFALGGAPAASPVAGGSPNATATVAPATPTDQPTDQPTDAPTDAPSPSPSPSPSVTPLALAPDDIGDALTDSNAPAPDDQVVDIAGANIQRPPDGGLDVVAMQVAPMPDGTNSRAQQVVVGMREVVEASGGIIAAQTRTVFTPLRGWYWQLHEGELTMGSFDDETGQPLPTEAEITHDLASGTFTFRIPAAELPENASWVGVISFHRPERTDERRRDVFGPVLFDDLPVP